MDRIEVQQGTPEWHEARQFYDTASEAPAAMGDSKYQTRDRLLAIKYAGGDDTVVHPATQRRFDQGHAAEALARPIIEQLIGMSFEPVVGVRNGLLASFDGLSSDNSIVFEHKLWNEKLVADIEQGELHDHYKWQLDQQLYVSGASQALFVCSDGTAERMAYLWYYRDEERIKRLLAGWEQFRKDLAAYQPTKLRLVEKVERPELPAIEVRVSALVGYNNVDYFYERVIGSLNAISTNLATDNDFAVAENEVKWCKATEKRVEQGMIDALNQAPELAEIFANLEAIQRLVRGKRLDLERLVKAEKQARQDAIIAAAVAEVGNEERLREAAKGKKTLETFQSAVNDEVARIKIEPIEPAPFQRAQVVVITYKDMKSGPRLISITGPNGSIEIPSAGDGKDKTIEVTL